MKKLLILLSLIGFAVNVFAQGDKLIFDENFDDNSAQWWVGDDEARKGEIKKGVYKLTNKDPEQTSIPRVSAVNLDDLNFTVEIKLKHVSGAENQYFGLRYGHNDSYKMDFGISANGWFFIREFYNGKFHDKIDWTKSEDLNGSKKDNVLKVVRNAQLQRFYINDKLVYTCMEKIYFGDMVGFISSNDITIEVDYLKVWTSPLIIPTVENPLEEVKFENLGSGVNGATSELVPRITADGNELYFGRKLPYSDGEKRTYIFHSKKQADGTWSTAERAPFPLNVKVGETVIAVSDDKNQLVMTGIRDSDGQFDGNDGLCISHRIENGWSLPENLTISDYVNTNDYAEFCMSSSGKVLFMTIENEDAIGVRDIFVSFLKNGKWTKPKNIGANVNSIEDEMSPFLAADGKTLYFSSEGLPGYGFNDVYVTRRLDDTWTNWSDPLNLGKGINKTGSESYFTVSASGEYGFISRTLDEGYGENDIYRIKLSESAKPDPLVLIHGKVLNKKSNDPISTEIRYVELGTDIEIGSALSAPGTGEYQISLPKGKKYAYYAKKEGFYSIEDNLDLMKLEKFEELEQDLYLAPIEKGEVIRLNNIFFETGKATLLTDSYSELDKLVKVLKSDKKLRIKILGHTDNVGSDATNQILSENRAKAVYAYLIEHGVKSDNLEFLGYGEAKPLETNETEEGRAINRRVEFEVL